MKEFLDDLTTRDQRMMFAVLTMVHTADTKEQLDNDTEALLTTARKHLCQFGVLKFQQLDGLNTAMPFGVRKIESFRTLTTESLAVFIPFRVQDICHTNGVYYGQNVISKNMIIADRRQLLNGNEFILGVSGGGKSFTAKGEVINQVLAGNADIIIIDPEREYSPLVRALGGEIINISATSPTYINAMDMNREYGDGANPVILKSEFIMSLCEQLIGGNNLGAVQKSIIDRCTASVYRTYQQNNYTGEVPTLQDFREELLKQSEPEAQEIALAIELFTNGSLNTFAKHTNVNTNNRLICYDILDLGKQLMPIGMLVVLDSILNRITQNRAKGKNTFIFIELSVHPLEACAKVRRLCHGHHAECGRPASVPHGKNDAGKLRVYRDAQSGIHGQIGACEATEHLGHPALVYHQCGCRSRTDQGRLQSCPVCQ